MKPWIYKNNEFINEDVPGGAFGFIYLIEIKIDGEPKFYIGKKQFHANRKVKKGKKEVAAMSDKRGSKKKLVSKLNFEKYCSSNKEIQESVKNGIEPTRTILKICYSKMELTYQEVRYMFKLDVLEKDVYLNDNILGKFYKSKLKQKSDEETV